MGETLFTEKSLSIAVMIIFGCVLWFIVTFIMDMMYCMIWKRWTVSMYLNAKPTFIEYKNSPEFIWVDKVKKEKHEH